MDRRRRHRRNAPALAAGVAAYEVCGECAVPSVDEGLEAESHVYSSLQAGPEFEAWRAATPVKPKRRTTEPAVLIERHGDELRVTLNRPERRNALGVDIRDGLLDAFAVADADPALRVVVAGAARRSAPAATSTSSARSRRPKRRTSSACRRASARRSRQGGRPRQVPRARRLLRQRHRTAGVRVARRGHPDTSFALPEIGLGLIPGAGGTVSMTKRIGVDRMLRAWVCRVSPSTPTPRSPGD